MIGVLVIASGVAVVLTILQPKESTADIVKMQYLENEQLVVEDLYSTETNSWHTWTRNVAEKDPVLPIKMSTDVPIVLVEEEKQETFSVRISGKQLVVRGIEMARYLGAEAKFYEESELLEIKKGNSTLVFRGSTAVVYENGVKTPSSAEALRQGNDLNVPLNVLANGLGYTLTWDHEQEALLLEKEQRKDEA